MQFHPAPGQALIPSSLRDGVVGVALLAVMAGAVAADLGGADAPLAVASAGLVVFAVFGWARLPLLGRLFAIAAVAAAGSTVLLTTEPLALMIRAVRQGALFGGLYVALSFLREAALKSPLVRQAGEELLRHSPRRRYTLLTGGAHLFGIVLNFGVLTLLGATVRQATADGDETRRRLLIATLRGFAVTPMWSPLSVGPVVALAHMGSLSWAAFAPAGLAGAIVMMALGSLLDGGHCPARAVAASVRGGWGAQLRLTGLIVLIIAVILGIRPLLEVGQITAIMIVLPPAAVLWMAAQAAAEEAPGGALGLRLRRMVASGLATSATEAMVLASAGFIGAVIAGEVDPATLAGLTAVLGLPVGALPPLAFLLIVGAAMIGLNPILTVMVTGAVIGDPATLGLSPVVLALAYVAAWAIAAGAGPFTASTMIIGRFAGVSARTVGLGLNGPYSLIAVVGWLAILSILPLLS